MAVLAKVSSPVGMVNCIFGGSKGVTSPLLIGKSISHVDNGRVRIPVVNPTAKIHQLGRSSVLGCIETVEDNLRMISIPTKKETDKRSPTKKLPSSDIKLQDTNLTQTM